MPTRTKGKAADGSPTGGAAAAAAEAEKEADEIGTGGRAAAAAAEVGKGDPNRTRHSAIWGRHDRSVSRGGTAICRNFNCGICKKPGKNDPNPENKSVCKFSHTCWNCRRPNCKGASRCSKAPVGSGNAVR